ncbi:MAG: pyridoxal-phosphate dependent enzyme, partial [Acidobacteriota bacterium]
GNNNIADSMFTQMAMERFAIPEWVVVSAGTGGTSSTIGRYIRYRPGLFSNTKLCVVDPENSVFFEYFQTGDATLTADSVSRIEGIGRPRVEPSFVPTVIDRMIRIPDAASIATVRWLEVILGRKCGGSTGTNLYGALQIATEMMRDGKPGSLVTMICDPGERYLDTYYDDGWLQEQGLDVQPYIQQLETFTTSGRLEAR